jgi:SAM-dependent methyltransferase
VGLGVFTDLAGRPRGAAELAAERGLAPESLELLLNALAAMDLLVVSDGLYGPTEAARRFLADGGEDSLSPLFRHQDHMWDLWSGLGKAIGDKGDGPTEEEELEDFIGTMAVNGRLGAPGVIGAIDLSGVERFLDLGGGPGSYAMEMVRRLPGVDAVLFDYPDILPIAGRHLAESGFKGKVRLLGGDLFTDDLGGGYDLILASKVLHIYGEDRIARILGRCLAALKSGGRAAFNDFWLEPPRTAPRRAAVFALHMLVVGRGGRTYSWEEMEGMLAAAGFTGIERLPVTDQGGVIVGRRP